MSTGGTAIFLLGFVFAREFLTQPEHVSDGLDGFAQTHVVRQNAAEAVRGQIGQEVEAVHLVRAQGGLKLGGNVRLDIDLDFRGAVLDAFPGLRVEHFRGLRVRKLHGVHAVGFPGKVEGVQAQAGDGVALGRWSSLFPGASSLRRPYGRSRLWRRPGRGFGSLESWTPSTSMTMRRSNQSISWLTTSNRTAAATGSASSVLSLSSMLTVSSSGSCLAHSANFSGNCRVRGP